jgi:N utilization substance protein B
MINQRDVRRCALQVLYQLDAGNAEPAEMLRQSLEGGPGDARTHDAAMVLARRAWDVRQQADAAVAAITPEWPTHRQPVVDRSILRLAYFEITGGQTPPKVAINEAVELAKEFSTAKSPTFINGVLDKIYRMTKSPMKDDQQQKPHAGAADGQNH